jgi:hypothetical protein
MLSITNRKISAFDVRWSSFSGFTILFNNPEDDSFLEDHSNRFYLNNDIENNSKLNFYKILDECIQYLNKDSLTNKYLFGILPSNTYHVTLWSGLNIRFVNQINPEYEPIVQKWLSNTYSNEIPKDIIELPSMSSLCLNRHWNIDFQFDRLDIWNNSVLVVRLRPHINSKLVFDQLCEDRLKLNKEYHNRFNVLTDSDVYKPHISLGYFANEEGALKASKSLDEWNMLFTNALQDKIISFNNANIYGFNDMIHFFNIYSIES